MDKNYAKSLLDKTRKDYNLIARDFSSTRRFIWKDLKPLTQYIMPNDKVLDLGCGNGRLLQLLKDMDIEYFGIDNSEELIRLAKQEYPNNNFRVADALNLPFPDNYFDKVYGIAIFHHIPSEELRLRFLEEVKRVLKPKGILIMTVWNLNQIKNWKLILKYSFLKIIGLSKLDFGDVLVPWAKTCQRYVHNFSRRGLSKLVKKAGFQVKEIGILKRPEKKDNNIYIVVGS